MDLNKKELAALYKKMSLSDMAATLGWSRATLHRWLVRYGIKRRSRSDAQRKHMKDGRHQRIGTTHSDETKMKISDKVQAFWESEEGLKYRSKLSDAGSEQWAKASTKERAAIISRLKKGKRPKAGELSHFGNKLYDFLRKYENVSAGMRLVPDHVSDIICHDRKVVIELILPIDIYGPEPAARLGRRYERLKASLNAAGFRVFIVEDRSDSISLSRCKRIYSQLQEFFNNTNIQNTKVVS
jgi:hypothetical protein